MANICLSFCDTNITFYMNRKGILFYTILLNVLLKFIVVDCCLFPNQRTQNLPV